MAAVPSRLLRLGASPLYGLLARLPFQVLHEFSACLAPATEIFEISIVEICDFGHEVEDATASLLILRHDEVLEKLVPQLHVLYALLKFLFLVVRTLYFIDEYLDFSAVI